MRTLMWFREHDLRSTDNMALYYASKNADEGVFALFIASPKTWQRHDMAPVRQDFMLRQLSLLKEELAANNGGWQWAASTGTDAVPYFRLFNPLLQSKRFDAQGAFILQYCAELRGLPIAMLHNPTRLSAQERRRRGYPAPIVDLATSRQQALLAFRELKNP